MCEIVDIWVPTFISCGQGHFPEEVTFEQRFAWQKGANIRRYGGGAYDFIGKNKCMGPNLRNGVFQE